MAVCAAQVNGQDNPRIQRIVIEEAPITSACFAVDGTEVIIGVRRGAFHYYDMIAGRVVAATRFKGERTHRQNETVDVSLWSFVVA